MRKSAIVVLVVVALANVAAWALLNRPASERPWSGVISGVSYSPYQVDQDPMDGVHPSVADMEGDMKLLAGQVASVRTYSSTSGAEQIAGLARRYGLPVMAGAWIQGKPDVDEPEIAGLIRVARSNPNVTRVIVGNEAIMRTDVTVEQAIAYIKRVKKQVNVPVSTAEPWHTFLKNPELVEAVDFIAVHLLPYWEDVPMDKALEYALFRYDELRKKYPNKHIVIAEVGWPSNGPWRHSAEASLINQAKFIRTFLNVAAERHFDYYIMEAFDQPWKRTLEGTAGTAWGIWDVYRQPKFPMSGEILENANWPMLCGASILFAMLPILWFIRAHGTLHLGGYIFYGGLIQVVVSMMFWTGNAAMTAGMALSTEIAWGVLFAAQIILFGVLLFDGFEVAEVVWGRHWRRRFEPVKAPVLDHAPKVSIHVPCYNEPPHMVIATMNALAKLNYPNFEVLVVDNNTKDEAIWKPLQEHCATLGERFRFFHLPQWPGYKAGALNFALDNCAPDTEVVAVIDSDYQVHPDWLSSTIPYFARPEVGFVQSPQDYREWQGDTFQRMCNWEYAGFFHIGMIQRNERNAIIQHGTMTLIRRTALEQVGRWGEWCITEDAELGLRLFEAGYEAVYMPDSFGKGLVPDSFQAYKTQRFRWAYGAVQILKRHWKDMLPGSRTLTLGQRYHFLTGWLPWFADAAHLIFGIAGVVWSIGLLALPKYFEFPPPAFMIPTLSVFLFKVAAGISLYQARVSCRFIDKLGAAVAGMALTHTVGRAVWQGLFTSGRPFVRTPKCENQPALMQGLLMAREEVILMAGLWLAALAITLVYGTQNRDAFLWSGLLVVQSLPYLAALATAMTNVLPEFRHNLGLAPSQSPPQPHTPPSASTPVEEGAD